jgi:hypothetical protein
MPSYFLNPHVHLGMTADAVVFLDLRTSRYLGLDASCLAAMHRLIDGPSMDGEDARLLANKLVGKGLITTDHARGKTLRPASVPPAHSALVPYDPDADGRAAGLSAAHHVRTFIVSVVVAHVRWKLVPLRRTVERVAARKIRALETSGSATDIDTARELVRIFQYLRPYFYSAQARCLVDTLTLIEFLARYDVYPEWVFGVQTRPFQAHTWLQHAGFTFNDEPARTNLYTPVLVV